MIRSHARKTPQPSLFLSHGSPMLALQDSTTGRFLEELARQWPRPDAIIVASAHYLAANPSIGAAPVPTTVYDFGGFSPELHRLHYPATGSPALAERIASLLWEAGISHQIETDRGLDHGVWVPLLRLYPEGGIPVVPISVDPRGDARAHYALGAALATLRNENVLLLGSGGFVHNLDSLVWSDVDAPTPAWVVEFAQWMRRRLLEGDHAALLDWPSRAPHARRAHPTPEHLMPLFVALGAGGPGVAARALHAAHEFGTLALDAFAFG
jgi:4,5-DOPA dioxygenase extradiol